MFCLEDVVGVSDTKTVLGSRGLEVDLLGHVGPGPGLANSVLGRIVPHGQGVTGRLLHVVLNGAGLE